MERLLSWFYLKRQQKESPDSYRPPSVQHKLPIMLNEINACNKQFNALPSKCNKSGLNFQF